MLARIVPSVRGVQNRASSVTLERMMHLDTEETLKVSILIQRSMSGGVQLFPNIISLKYKFQTMLLVENLNGWKYFPSEGSKVLSAEVFGYSHTEKPTSNWKP